MRYVQVFCLYFNIFHYNIIDFLLFVFILIGTVHQMQIQMKYKLTFWINV